METETRLSNIFYFCPHSGSATMRDTNIKLP